MQKTIVSLFDYSGNWSRPYRENGYKVIQVDLQLGTDVMNWPFRAFEGVTGVLAACPCTDFSRAGAHLWPAKDADGRTAKSIALVYKTLEIINYYKQRGLLFWAIENPTGSRIDKLVPELRRYRLLKFQPFEFGEDYSKNTMIWGEFSPYLVRNANQKNSRGDITTAAWPGAGRSNTPLGFAYSFYYANAV